jgi:hypothetical protein
MLHSTFPEFASTRESLPWEKRVYNLPIVQGWGGAGDLFHLTYRATWSSLQPSKFPLHLQNFSQSGSLDPDSCSMVMESLSEVMIEECPSPHEVDHLVLGGLVQSMETV